MVASLLVRVCAFVLQRVPLALTYAVSDAVSWLLFLFWREKRAAIIENMSQVLGPGASPSEVSRMARLCVRNYCRYVVDFARFPRLDGSEVARQVRFSDWTGVEEAFRAGRGLIFIGLHMGYWDVGGAALAQRRFPLSVVAEPVGSPRLDEFVQGMRTRWGMRVISLKDAARGILRVLRRNEVLALLIDCPQAEEGVAVRFFNRCTRVARGPAALSLRTGASLVPAAVVRQPDNTYRALVGSVIQPLSSGDLERDIQALTQRAMEALEKMVRQYPDQWYAFRRMWTGEADADGEAAAVLGQ